MFKAYKFKLKPNKEQLVQLNEWAGASRWIWNYMLSLNKTNHEETGKFVFKYEMMKALPELKKEYQWLKEIPSQSLQQKCLDLDLAICKVWKNKAGFPKFKSKKYDDCSIRVPQDQRFKTIDPRKKQIKIPKIGWIKWNKYRNLEGRLKYITLKQENGYWWCVCLCEMDDIEGKEFNINDLVGIDLGLKDFAITSDGEIFSTPKLYRKKQRQLKLLQRKHAKKKKSSKNKEKARKKLNKLHYKIKNQRKDFTHKASSSIVKNYNFIAVENLNIKGMIKNKKLSKSISDQGWAMFVSQLEYKSKAKGGATIKIDRFAPSTKTCSNCGHKQKITLEQRTFDCEKCPLVMDRDLNAAINIKAFGLKKLGVGHTLMPVEIPLMEGEDASSPSYVSAKQEKFSSIGREAS